MTDTPPSREHGTDEPPAGRHLLRTLVRHTVGRTGLLVAVLAVLVGLGVTGTVALTAGRGTGPDLAAPAAAGRDRTQAADRADRADRSEPEAPPTTTAPTPGPSTSDAPGRAEPAATDRTGKAPAAARTKSRPKPRKAWVTPMPGAEITSCFGMRWGVLHAGIDLAQPAGTPIHAAGAGTVVDAGWAFAGYGISVVIDHGNGFLTHYAHQSQTIVSVGQKVRAGQVIGYEGSTGDSTGPHLHFEVHAGSLWNQIDPAPWMRARGVDLGC